jgi:hypothetical protein
MARWPSGRAIWTARSPGAPYFVCVSAAIVPAVWLAAYFGWTVNREQLDELIDEVDKTFAEEPGPH